MDDEKPPLARNSDAWIRELKPWINKRLEELRDQLEELQPNPDYIRGCIAMLRGIIRAVEPDLPEEGTAAAYFPQGKSPS